jgi:hypothetical protein
VNNEFEKIKIPKKQRYVNNKQKVIAMSRHDSKGADNKTGYSERAKWTSTPKKKRPSKERGPYGDNTGTVQKRDQRTKKD